MLLDEEDRIKYLKELKVNQSNLLKMLSSLPLEVEMRSFGVKFKKMVLERKLKEIEENIKQLSRTKVLISNK